MTEKFSVKLSQDFKNHSFTITLIVTEEKK